MSNAGQSSGGAIRGGRVAHANGKLVLAASKANLFLDAKELALALAEDEAGNVVKVARQVVADEGGEDELRIGRATIRAKVNRVSRI